MREEKSKYVLRHNTEQTWQLYNPILLSGEIGLSEYTHEDNTVQTLFKIGDGTTPWNDLPFVQPKTDTTLTLPYVAADAAAVGARIGYLDSELQTLKQTCVEIQDFSIMPKYTEAGVTLGVIVLSWVLDNYSTIASQTINGVSISPEVRSLTLEGEFTQSTTFNLVVTDGIGNVKTAQTKLEVLYPVFYGVSTAQTTYSEGFIYGLSKVIPTKEEFEFSTASAESEYIYFCAPDSYGECTFFHRGFEGGVQYVDSVSLHLSETLVETYNIYRSDYPGLGNTRLRVTFSTGPHTDLTIEPTLPSGGTQGQILMKASNQDYDTYWANLPKEVPNGGTTGQVLAKRSDATGDLEWKDFEGALPNVSSVDNGKILKVTNGRWDVGSEARELPNMMPEDSGKFLMTDNGEPSWAEIPSQLPATSAADEGDVLVVDGSGRWIKKPVTYEGAVVHEGSGAPTYTVVCKKGDFYRDTTNNKLYFCWRYISPDPSTATELTGVTLTLNSTGTYPEDGLEDYTVTYDYMGQTYGRKLVEIKVADNVIKMTSYELNNFGQHVNYTTTLCDGNVPDRSQVAITAATIAFNEQAYRFNDIPLIQWFVANAASMSGTGSYWVEVVAKPDAGFPTVTNDDNGKIAVVRSGAWDKEYPQWTATYHGTGAPVGSIVATPGDFYRDDSSNELYQCVEYIDPYHITDLTGITFYFNPTVNNSNYNSGSSLYINFTIGSDYYTAMTIGYTSSISRNMLSYFNNSTGWVNLVYDSYLGRGWSDESYRTITITGGAKATDTDFINWIFSNAVASGLGSQWVKLCPQESTLPEPSYIDEGKVLTVGSSANYELQLPSVYENTLAPGAPTTSLVASKGDVYIDTTTGESYACTSYTPFSELTTLEDAVYTFDENVVFPETPTGVTYPYTLFEYDAAFSYESNGTPRDGLRIKGIVDELQISIQVYDEDTEQFNTETETIEVYQLIYIYDDNGTETEEIVYDTANQYESTPLPIWTYQDTRYLTFGSTGDDIDNMTYIEWLLSVGIFTGYGSTWLHLSTERRLPEVTQADDGKILIVQNGQWIMVPLSSLLGGN